MRDQVNARGEDGDSPLHIACLYGQAAVVEECIKRGADVNARDADARTPLHQAVGASLHDVAQLLLEAGADATLGSKTIGMKNTALHQAVERGDEAMARLLIRTAQHLDVDAAGANGLTPLCLAARSNKVACAQVLVEGGADPRAATAFMGKSALDIARANERVAILKLFGDEAAAP